MLSIIMPTYNKASYLNNTLNGFLHQTCCNYQLIIVDDGSTDNTANVIDKFSTHLPIYYIKQERGGVIKARNTALIKAEGENIVFCDDDRMPSPNYVSSYCEALQNNTKHVVIGWKNEILSCDHEQLPNDEKVIKARQGMKNDGFFFSQEQLNNDYQKILKQFYYRTPYDNYTFVIQKYGTELNGFHLGFGMAITGNAGYNRRGASDVMFDTNFIGWGCEDTEFMYQLKLKGYKFICEPNASSYHQKHMINREKRQNELVTNMAYFCQKHPYGDVYSYWSSFQSQDRSYDYIAANEAYNRILELKTSDPLYQFWIHILKCWKQNQQEILRADRTKIC